MRHSCSGFATGSERSITCCTSVKIAVVAPMPSPSVINAVAVKPGDLWSWRRACLKSDSMLSPSACALNAGASGAPSLLRYKYAVYGKKDPAGCPLLVWSVRKRTLAVTAAGTLCIPDPDAHLTCINPE